MADKHYEEHVLNLIKVRSEIRKAGEDFLQKDYSGEAYRMCRAKAMAEALGITDDEFFLHKSIVEKELDLEANLISPEDIAYYCDEKIEIYVLTEIVDNDAPAVTVFQYKRDGDIAFNEILDKYYKWDRFERDDNGYTYEDCKKFQCFYLRENIEHTCIWCALEKKKVQ